MVDNTTFVHYHVWVVYAKIIYLHPPTLMIYPWSLSVWLIFILWVSPIMKHIVITFSAKLLVLLLADKKYDLEIFIFDLVWEMLLWSSTKSPALFFARVQLSQSNLSSGDSKWCWLFFMDKQPTLFYNNQQHHTSLY